MFVIVTWSYDSPCTQAEDLAGVKILHGLDKVIEGGAVVLTLRDQNILTDGDINEGNAISILDFFVFSFLFLSGSYAENALHPTEADMLENVEIGEQKRRDEAYKAAKKKTGTYDDK